MNRRTKIWACVVVNQVVFFEMIQYGHISYEKFIVIL